MGWRNYIRRHIVLHDRQYSRQRCTRWLDATRKADPKTSSKSFLPILRVGFPRSTLGRTLCVHFDGVNIIRNSVYGAILSWQVSRSQQESGLNRENQVCRRSNQIQSPAKPPTSHPFLAINDSLEYGTETAANFRGRDGRVLRSVVPIRRGA